ncbi:MAG: CHAD domain-containing protein [Opitutales bacterium]|jgi:CHAD domain-containing protein
MSAKSVKRSIAPKRAGKSIKESKSEPMVVVAEALAPPVEMEPAGESPDALRVREGVRAGLIRLARRLTRDALRHIEHPESVDRTEDIHQVRVQCKRLRALMRLLRPVADRAVLSHENARLRDAARALSDFRDAFVAGETLKRVFDDTAPRRVKDAAVLLGVQSGGPKRTRDLYAGFEHAAQDLREMLAVLKKLSVPARGWTAVAPGLERSYRRSQESYLKCRKRHGEQLAECFHEWRKRVKDLAYQLEFLDNVEPTVVRHLRKEFRRLGTMLGEDHDYVVFAEQVRERERHYEHLATFHPVRKRLRRRLKELRAREFALGGPLLAEPPEMWIARLAGLWLRWKNPKLAQAEAPVAPLPAVPAETEVSIAVAPKEAEKTEETEAEEEARVTEEAEALQEAAVKKGRGKKKREA